VAPSTNGPNGEGDRDSRGRFTKGNPGGPGNPFASKTSKLRSALLGAVTQTAMRRIIKAIVAEAEKGDVQAAKLVFDRCLGPAEALDVLRRLEQIEERLNIKPGV